MTLLRARLFDKQPLVVRQYMHRAWKFPLEADWPSMAGLVDFLQKRAAEVYLIFVHSLHTPSIRCEFVTAWET